LIMAAIAAASASSGGRSVNPPGRSAIGRL
jgi:hypothetical protein